MLSCVPPDSRALVSDPDVARFRHDVVKVLAAIGVDQDKGVIYEAKVYIESDCNMVELAVCSE
jgi:hypothetical protein